MSNLNSVFELRQAAKARQDLSEYLEHIIEPLNPYDNDVGSGYFVTAQYTTEVGHTKLIRIFLLANSKIQALYKAKKNTHILQFIAKAGLAGYEVDLTIQASGLVHLSTVLDQIIIHD